MEHSEDKFGVLYSSDGKTLIGVQDKKKFCCSHYSIKDGVKYIEPNAFHQCQNLKSIYMPDSVTDDGGSIFEGCRNLEQARISAKLKNPNIAMFNGCSSLAEVELPEGIESIGENMFSGCVSLTKINIPSTRYILRFRHCYYQLARRDKDYWIRCVHQLQELKVTHYPCNCRRDWSLASSRAQELRGNNM